MRYQLIHIYRSIYPSFNGLCLSTLCLSQVLALAFGAGALSLGALATARDLELTVELRQDQ